MKPVDDSELDPVFVSSLREAKSIFGIWLVMFAWVITVGLFFGYATDPKAPIETTLGMPSWVFWGVFVPWGVTSLFTIWFALTQMADHPLEDPDSLDASDG